MNDGGSLLCSVLDSLPMGIGVLAPDGTILDFNCRAIERYKLRLEEVRGRPFAEINPWTFSPTLQDKLRGALAQAAEGQSVRFEIEVPTPSGRPVVEQAWLTPIIDEAGRVTHLVFSGEDTTERRRAEESLRRSQDQLEAIIASVDGIVWEADPNTVQFTFVSPQAERMLGYHLSQWTESPTFWADHIHPDDRQHAVDYCTRCSQEKRNHQLDYRMVAADGRAVWLRDIVTVVVEDGQLTKLRGIMVDITERRTAEQQLAVSERRLRTIFDNDPECVKLLGAGCKLLEMNPAGLRIIEAESLSQVVGQSMLDLVLPEYRNAFSELSERVLNGKSETLEFEIQGLKGMRRWLETHAVPLHDELGEVRVLGITRDVTERKRTAEHLRRTSDLLAAVAEGTTDALFVKDLEGRYLLCNPAAARFMRRSPTEVIGHTDSEFFDAGSARVIADRDRHVRESGLTETQEEELTAGGETRNYMATKSPYRDAAGNIIGVMGISRDITDRKRLESQFHQSQKMEAVGQLAGGVAHDFNNLLTIISGYSDILLSALAPEDPMRESVEAISQAGERAAGLTRQLLAFSRQSVLEPKVLDLNTIVNNTSMMLRRLIGEDVLLTTVLEPNLSRVKVDPTQIEQVLMNLAVNARDALPKGGKLTIETSNVELGVLNFLACAPGRYVLLKVSDTGCGMTSEVRARIFEPFFTTKGVGKGTGLGLAMVFGVVKQSGGGIEVQSEPGTGTTFKIFLPARDEKVAASEKKDVVVADGGAETILLVEDDEGVRGLALHVLRSRGYDVLAAKGGRDAFHVIEKYQGAIDLLVTDVVMPGMGGLELAESLRPRFPQMKVLFSSGYTDDAVVRHGVMHDDVFFLRKPYGPLSLATKVREVLDV